MKKSVSILILSIFVLSSTEIHQLLKLPVLIQHFIEHKQSDSGISFTDFLKMHYDENSRHQPKEHHHEKLPFKSDGCGLNHTVIAEVHFFSTDLSFKIYSHKKENIHFREDFYSSSSLSSIWQPPKVS